MSKHYEDTIDRGTVAKYKTTCRNKSHHYFFPTNIMSRILAAKTRM